jgi:hypothetical protein
MDQEGTRERAPDAGLTGSEAAADARYAMVGQEPLPTHKPSQAEGDRETVDQAIREHEDSGELY